LTLSGDAILYATAELHFGHTVMNGDSSTFSINNNTNKDLTSVPYPRLIFNGRKANLELNTNISLDRLILNHCYLFYGKWFGSGSMSRTELWGDSIQLGLYDSSTIEFANINNSNYISPHPPNSYCKALDLDTGYVLKGNVALRFINYGKSVETLPANFRLVSTPGNYPYFRYYNYDITTHNNTCNLGGDIKFDPYVIDMKTYATLSYGDWELYGTPTGSVGADLTFNTNNYNIESGFIYFGMGSSGGLGIFNFGSSTLYASMIDISNSYSGNGAVYNLQASKFILNYSMSINSNCTINPGTSALIINENIFSAWGPFTFSSGGKHFDTLRIAVPTQICFSNLYYGHNPSTAIDSHRVVITAPLALSLECGRKYVFLPGYSINGSDLNHLDSLLSTSLDTMTNVKFPSKDTMKCMYIKGVNILDGDTAFASATCTNGGSNGPTLIFLPSHSARKWAPTVSSSPTNWLNYSLNDDFLPDDTLMFDNTSASPAVQTTNMKAKFLFLKPEYIGSYTQNIGCTDTISNLYIGSSSANLNGSIVCSTLVVTGQSQFNGKISVYKKDSSFLATPTYGVNAVREYLTPTDTGKIYCNTKSKSRKNQCCIRSLEDHGLVAG
jgi:hypothetical protein